MLIAFLIYLINVFESIQKLACIFLVIGVCLFGISLLFIVIGQYFDSDAEIEEKVVKKVAKYVSIFFIVLSLIVVFVPRSETMYLMIGAYLGTQIVEKPEVSEKLSKVYKIIDHKLDEVLDDLEQKSKVRDLETK